MKFAEGLSHITTSNDKDNIHWVNDYIEQLPRQQQLYNQNILINFYSFHGKDWNSLTFDDCQAFVDYLIRIHVYNKLSRKVLIKKVNVITNYLTFLSHQKFENVDTLLWKWSVRVNKLKGSEKTKISNKKKKKKVLKKKRQREEKLPDIIYNFLHYLKRHNYDVITYKKTIKPFLRFVKDESIDINIFYETDKEKLLIEKIKGYERKIAERLSKEEIGASTATNYLRAVQLFIKYLCNKGVIERKYSIPVHLRNKGKQANQYVPKGSIIHLMNTIYEHSNHVLRDLAIFLLIVDTGCRPIEISNLTLNDYNKIERTLPFECEKSERRILKISHEVAEVINEYLTIRDTYNPQTECLFCDYRGFAISSSLISNIFYTTNIKAFGESKYSPKAFRHRFITDALQEYDFQQVAKIVGHKHWKSTNYYVYHSTQRLLNNTLDKSPLKK